MLWSHSFLVGELANSRHMLSILLVVLLVVALQYYPYRCLLMSADLRECRPLVRDSLALLRV
jgi:hypothetical protein